MNCFIFTDIKWEKKSFGPSWRIEANLNFEAIRRLKKITINLFLSCSFFQFISWYSDWDFFLRHIPMNESWTPLTLHNNNIIHTPPYLVQLTLSSLECPWKGDHSGLYILLVWDCGFKTQCLLELRDELKVSN